LHHFLIEIKYKTRYLNGWATAQPKDPAQTYVWDIVYMVYPNNLHL